MYAVPSNYRTKILVSYSNGFRYMVWEVFLSVCGYFWLMNKEELAWAVDRAELRQVEGVD